MVRLIKKEQAAFPISTNLNRWFYNNNIDLNAVFTSYFNRGEGTLKGAAGKPDPLYKLQTGLSAQAYLTAIGLETSGLNTITTLPLMVAVARWNMLSSPAIEKPLTIVSPLVLSPPAVCVNKIFIVLLTIIS